MSHIGIAAITNGAVLVVQDDTGTLMWGMTLTELDALRKQIEHALLNPQQCSTVAEFSAMAITPAWT